MRACLDVDHPAEALQHVVKALAHLNQLVRCGRAIAPQAEPSMVGSAVAAPIAVAASALRRSFSASIWPSVSRTQRGKRSARGGRSAGGAARGAL